MTGMRNKQATQVSPLANTTISSQQSGLPVSQGQTQVLSLEHNHHTSSIMFKGQGGEARYRVRLGAFRHQSLYGTAVLSLLSLETKTIFAWS